MSVVKSKRGKSKVEFEMNYFRLADGIDNLVENYFFAEHDTIQQHKLFIKSRAEALEHLTDELVYHIKIANSIYPTCYEEWADRRVEMGKAIGTCYAILTNLQRVMMRLRIPDNNIFVIGRSKAELSVLLEDIKKQLADLLLEVNEKKTHIVKLSHGFTWLQVKYHVKPTGRILKMLSHGKIVRERRRLKAFRRMLNKGQMTEDEIWNAYQSWRGTIIIDHNACARSIEAMDKLYASLFPPHKEAPKPSRRALVIQANRELDPEDLKYIV